MHPIILSVVRATPFVLTLGERGVDERFYKICKYLPVKSIAGLRWGVSRVFSYIIIVRRKKNVSTRADGVVFWFEVLKSEKLTPIVYVDRSDENSKLTPHPFVVESSRQLRLSLTTRLTVYTKRSLNFVSIGRQ